MYDRTVDVPRLLCFYGEDAPLPDPALDACRAALSGYYAAELGEPFVTAGLCFYRDERDSVAWHGDTIGRGSTQDTMVAIVSLGEARPLLLRPRAEPAAPAPSGTTSGTATSSSWAAAASAPGSTPCPSRPARPGRGSASSSARGACADRLSRYALGAARLGSLTVGEFPSLVATDLDGTIIRATGRSPRAPSPRSPGSRRPGRGSCWSPGGRRG